jgi:hypothetical protein
MQSSLAVRRDRSATTPLPKLSAQIRRRQCAAAQSNLRATSLSCTRHPEHGKSEFTTQKPDEAPAFQRECRKDVPRTAA